MNELTALSTALSKQQFMQQLVTLPADIFQNYHNKTFFEAIKELSEQHENIDLSMVIEHYKIKGKNVDADFLTKLLKSEISLNPAGLLKLLKDNLHKENIRKNVVNLWNKVKVGDIENIDVFLDNIKDIRNSENLDEAGELSDYANKSLDDIYQDGTYVKTGFWQLDERIIGLFNGQYVTIAATPGMGKTTFAFQLALNIKDTVFFSMEMKRYQLYAKYLSQVAGVEVGKIYSKKLNDSEFKRVLSAKEKSKELTIKVYDNQSNIFFILNAIKDEVKNNGKKLIVIDYLQLLVGSPGLNTVSRIEHATRAIKSLAFELNVPIIVLSQLTKDVIKDNRRPTSGDLRGSGSIHQDSDVVMFLWESNNSSVLIVDKLREGRTGDIDTLTFEKQFSRFTDRVSFGGQQ